MKTTQLFILMFLVSLCSAESLPLCGNDAKAQALAAQIIQSPWQQRPELYCDPLLVQLAREKAAAMAKQGLISHTLGLGANQRLKEAGFALPRLYPLFSNNNVEVILGGPELSEAAFSEFMSSTGHRTHLMGEHPFYRSQTHMGVGHVYDKHSPHVDYWVVYIAHHRDWHPKLTAALMAKK